MADDLNKKEEQLQQRLEKLKSMEEEIKKKEKVIKEKEKAKKQMILRLSPGLWEEIAAWAEDDFRSVNGQIEYLLTEAVKKRRKVKIEEPEEENFEEIEYIEEETELLNASAENGLEEIIRPQIEAYVKSISDGRFVRKSPMAKGAVTNRGCTVGCVGCGLCQQLCPKSAIVGGAK